MLSENKEEILEFVRKENLNSSEKEFSWAYILYLMKDYVFW